MVKLFRNRCLKGNIVRRSPQMSREYDVIQATSLAQTAIYKCFNEKDLRECDQLSRIESTLMEWCRQGDQSACDAFALVGQMKIVEQMRQNIG
jgi:hypothetical protein